MKTNSGKKVKIFFPQNFRRAFQYRKMFSFKDFRVFVRKSPFTKIFIIEAFDHDSTIYLPFESPSKVI